MKTNLTFIPFHGSTSTEFVGFCNCNPTRLQWNLTPSNDMASLSKIDRRQKVYLRKLKDEYVEQQWKF